MMVDDGCDITNSKQKLIGERCFLSMHCSPNFLLAVFPTEPEPTEHLEEPFFHCTENVNMWFQYYFQSAALRFPEP